MVIVVNSSRFLGGGAGVGGSLRVLLATVRVSAYGDHKKTKCDSENRIPFADFIFGFCKHSVKIKDILLLVIIGFISTMD